jgi:hypothetical protein
MTRARRILAGSLFVALVAGIAIAGWNYERLLDRYAPFDFDRVPNFLTPLHFHLMKTKPERCFAALERAEIVHTRPSSYEGRDGCGYSNAALLQRSGISYGGRVLLQCPAMAALLLWERQVLGPAAERHLGKKVTAIRSLGTYSCRKVYRSREGRLSQHANANAIDLAAFTFSDGSRVTVLQDWNDTDVKGRFLRAVRDGACSLFGAVLSPDFNAAHRNHFHFDMGPGRVCR